VGYGDPSGENVTSYSANDFAFQKSVKFNAIPGNAAASEAIIKTQQFRDISF
jgi:hypothetical protein